MESVGLKLWCLLTISTSAFALETVKPPLDVDADIISVIQKYLSKVPDIEERYVVSEPLAKVLTRFFSGKISALPLFKVSAKIDRKPVKIPWTLTQTGASSNDTGKLQRPKIKKYKLVSGASLASNHTRKRN